MNTLLDPDSTEFQILIVPHIYITFTLFSALHLNMWLCLLIWYFCLIWMLLATITFPLIHNQFWEIVPFWAYSKEIGLALIQPDVKWLVLSSVSSSILKLQLYEDYFVDIKDFTISAAPLWMSFWTVNFIATITSDPLTDPHPIEDLFTHYHIHLTVLCVIYCGDETHKVASYTQWLKMLSPPFNLAPHCCYVWWIAGLTYSSSDLIWIVACS